MVPGKPDPLFHLPNYYQILRSEIFNLISPDCKNILDIGCGAGILLSSYKKFVNPDAHIVGIEIYPPAGKAAHHYLDEIYIDNIEEPAQKEYTRHKYDCIILADVLEHLRDPKAVLEKLKPLLTENGKIITSVPNVLHYSVMEMMIKQGQWKYQDAGILDRTHLRFFSAASFEEMIESCSLQIAHKQSFSIGTLPEEYHSLIEERRRSEYEVYQYHYVLIPQKNPQDITSNIVFIFLNDVREEMIEEAEKLYPQCRKYIYKEEGKQLIQWMKDLPENDVFFYIICGNYSLIPPDQFQKLSHCNSLIPDIFVPKITLDDQHTMANVFLVNQENIQAINLHYNYKNINQQGNLCLIEQLIIRKNVLSEIEEVSPRIWHSPKNPILYLPELKSQCHSTPSSELYFQNQTIPLVYNKTISEADYKAIITSPARHNNFSHTLTALEYTAEKTATVIEPSMRTDRKNKPSQYYMYELNPEEHSDYLCDLVLCLSQMPENEKLYFQIIQNKEEPDFHHSGEYQIEGLELREQLKMTGAEFTCIASYPLQKELSKGCRIYQHIIECRKPKGWSQENAELQLFGYWQRMMRHGFHMNSQELLKNAATNVLNYPFVPENDIIEFIINQLLQNQDFNLALQKVDNWILQSNQADQEEQLINIKIQIKQMQKRS